MFQIFWIWVGCVPQGCRQVKRSCRISCLPSCCLKTPEVWTALYVLILSCCVFVVVVNQAEASTVSPFDPSSDILCWTPFFSPWIHWEWSPGHKLSWLTYSGTVVFASAQKCKYHRAFRGLLFSLTGLLLILKVIVLPGPPGFTLLQPNSHILSAVKSAMY